MDGGAFNYMEREILFRGRRTDNDEWIDGALLCFSNGETRIATSCLAGDVPNLFNVCAYEVAPETVGQYIGNEDNTGAWICEGDIVKGKVHMLGGYRVRTGVIVYYINAFKMRVGNEYKEIPFQCEVIGNIHDKEDESND